MLKKAVEFLLSNCNLKRSSARFEAKSSTGRPIIGIREKAHETHIAGPFRAPDAGETREQYEKLKGNRFANLEKL